VSLHGTLETFALPDVLTLLSTTGKTGELRVNGERFDGRVWLDGGLLVGTAVGNAPTFVDALFDLLRLKTGSFSFEADATAPNASTPEPIAPVLEEAQGRLEQWREIEAVVPSMASAVRLVAEVGRERVSLRDGQWRVVVAVAGHRTVGEVLAALGLGEFDGCKVVKDLVDAGLMAVDGAPAVEAVPPAQPEAPQAEVAPAAEPAKVADVAPDPVEAAQPADVAQVAEARGEEPERPVGRAGGRSRRARAAAAAAEQAEVEAADENDSRAMAQALVRQLASLDEVETPSKGPKGRGAEVASAEDVPAEGAEDQPRDGAESDDEPINRGLLLKFLSSVRN
jgi:hypothetical protein